MCKYLLPVVLVLAALFYPEKASHAASLDEPAFRKTVFTANYPWKEGLTLDFILDEEKCKNAYGKQWRVKCSAALGRPGDEAKGIELSPPAPGYWQWQGPATLVFVPENGKSIKPGTQYVVDAGKLFHPRTVKFDTLKKTLTTFPIGAQLLSSSFMADPSSKGRHRITAAFRFNYPFPEDKNPVSLSVPAQAASGKAEYIWNADHDLLNISWPVTTLAPANGQARMALKGIGQIIYENGSLFYRTPSEKVGESVFFQSLPGEENIFNVKKAEIQPILTENLDESWQLDLETTLSASEDEILKNLQVLQLPKFNGKAAYIPYDWTRSPGLSQEMLHKSEKLEPVSVSKSGLPRSKFSFSLNPEKGRYILVVVDKKLASVSGYGLKRDWIQILQVPEQPQRLGFLQPGNILKADKNAVLDIYSTGLDRIEWKAQKILDPFLAMTAAGSGDIFSIPFENFQLDLDSISESREGRLAPPVASQGKGQFSQLALADILPRETNQSGLVYIVLKGYSGNKEIACTSRLILAASLGLWVKKSEQQTYNIFAADLESGLPAENVNIRILGANGKEILSGVTDNRGNVKFPSLSGYKRESRPVAILAAGKNHFAWLPLEDRSREISLADFPVNGVHVADNGILSHIFNQRGVYRPGDTLHFGLLTRHPDFSLLPEQLPLFAQLLDPAGNTIYETNIWAGKNGLAEIAWQSSPTSSCGKYELNIRNARGGEVISSTAARIEEFQPETLKLKVEVDTPAGWLPVDTESRPLGIAFYLQNLYGAPANGNRLKATLSSSPAVLNFKGYEDYTFHDPASFAGQGVKMDLGTFVSNSNGAATLEIDQNRLARHSATYSVFCEGFEKGAGRAVTGTTSFLALPMRKIAGYRPINSLTNLKYIPRKSTAKLNFIALNPNLEYVEWKDLEFSISRRDYVTNLISDSNGGYRYDETPVNRPLKEWRQDIDRAGCDIPLLTDKAGEFVLLVKEAGKIIAEASYLVAGDGPLPPDSIPDTAKMRIQLDRQKYLPGETINISLSVPYGGTGLITLERNGVEAFSWFSADAGSCVRQMTIPEDFEGKGYVSVSFVRSHHSPDIYSSPHINAVASFIANISARKLDININAPEKSLPGLPLKVNISSDKPGNAIVYAVDEGILQLTSFKNPQPLEYLLADRALDVRTLQAFDLLMPDHEKIAARISPFGGGMSGPLFGSRFENPFKRKNEPPVVWWSGIIAVGPEPVALNVPVPQWYNGKLRIMAVGTGAEKIGSQTKYCTISAPVVLTPRFPVSVSPGDEFEGSLVITNLSSKNAKISIKAKADDVFTVLEKLPDEITLKPSGEIALPIKVRTGDIPGAAYVRFTATCDGGEYERASSISVRPPSPLRTELKSGIIMDDTLLKVERQVYEQNSNSVLTLSALPLPLAQGLMRYLDTYPHGCTEQLVSKAMAAIQLKSLNTDIKDQEKVDRLVNAAINAIRERYNGSAISLWPDSDTDYLLTVYAADFLLSLREAGLAAADNLLRQLCDSIEYDCSLKSADLLSARTCAYGIWVLTRSGRITTQLIENLLDALRQCDTVEYENDLTMALLAASQKEMQVRDCLQFDNIIYKDTGWFDTFAQQAILFTILQKYFPDKCTADRLNEFFEAIQFAMLEKSYATFSASQGIRAVQSLASKPGRPDTKATLECMDNSSQAELAASMLTHESPWCKNYMITLNEQKPPVFWQLTTTGYDRDLPARTIANGLEISREYLDENGEPAKNIHQGDIVLVRLTARAHQNEIKDCVITDMLPGGFEMVFNKNDVSQENGVRHMDRREDRMLLFADLSSEPLVFTYRIRAINPGRFTIPPVMAEAMYNQALYGQSGNGMIYIGAENNVSHP